MVQVEQPPDRPLYGSEPLGRHQRWKLDKRTAAGWRRERNIAPIVHIAAERRNETIRSLSQRLGPSRALGQRLWNVGKRHEQGTVALRL